MSSHVPPCLLEFIALIVEYSKCLWALNLQATLWFIIHVLVLLAEVRCLWSVRMSRYSSEWWTSAYHLASCSVRRCQASRLHCILLFTRAGVPRIELLKHSRLWISTSSPKLQLQWPTKIWMTMWALWKSQMEMKLPIKAFASQWISTRTAMAGRFAEDAQEVAGLPESVEG